MERCLKKEELNIKILKCLDRSWQPKVTALSESKDLTSMTTASLFGKLKEQELEMNMLNVQKNEEKHVRNIVLKTAGHKKCQDSSDDSEGETLSLLTRKFSKFLKKNSNKNQSSYRYNSKKLNDFNSNKYTCFGCGEQGHIKVDCPNNENKKRGASKKGEKKGKAKKVYIDWQDNDVSSSSLFSGDEEANLCLMAKEETDVSTVSSSTSINFENYNQLLDAFKETHEEPNKLALSKNRLKGLNNWMENRVKALEEELDNLKNDFENLELIYKTLLANVTQVFVKIVNLLKRRFTIL